MSNSKWKIWNLEEDWLWGGEGFLASRKWCFILVCYESSCYFNRRFAKCNYHKSSDCQNCFRKWEVIKVLFSAINHWLTHTFERYWIEKGESVTMILQLRAVIILSFLVWDMNILIFSEPIKNWFSQNTNYGRCFQMERENSSCLLYS